MDVCGPISCVGLSTSSLLETVNIAAGAGVGSSESSRCIQSTRFNTPPRAAPSRTGPRHPGPPNPRPCVRIPGLYLRAGALACTGGCRDPDCPVQPPTLAVCRQRPPPTVTKFKFTAAAARARASHGGTRRTFTGNARIARLSCRVRS